MFEMNKEIVVFSCGDSRDISTWSNVPYFFTETLIQKGYKVHRVNIAPNNLINRLFNTSSYYFFVKLLKRKACLVYKRTFTHRFFTYRKIKKATKQYPDVDFNLFLGFDFYNPYSNSPNVLWCDWTDEMVISRSGRIALRSEKASLHHEEDVIKKADLVFSLFPICAKQMSERYSREVHYLERNVINSFCREKTKIKEIVETREKSNRLLFIGDIRYLGAAELLIDAFRTLKKEYPDLSLHIIGISEDRFKEIPNGVHCYGYLHKGIEHENTLYYDLLLSAKVLVNPASKWGAYSSTVEAMSFGCPVIIAPYEDFVEEFGRTISFGLYNEKFDRVELVRNIKRLIDSDNYERFCRSAYAAVKDYTWSSYVDRFLEYTYNHIS